jgi:hypothetical protein
MEYKHAFTYLIRHLYPCAVGTCSVMVRADMPTAARAVCINLLEIILYNANGALIDSSLLSATSTSTYHNLLVARLIDGNDATMAHTWDSGNGDGNPRMRVYYPCTSGSTSLSRVVVVNRKDCCSERINGFFLDFLNASGRVDRPSYQFAGSLGQFDITPGACSWGPTVMQACMQGPV